MSEQFVKQFMSTEIVNFREFHASQIDTQLTDEGLSLKDAEALCDYWNSFGRWHYEPYLPNRKEFIVSVVVIKHIPTGITTQNKLYRIEASGADEASGKAFKMASDDFPDFSVHTICHWELE